LPSYEAACVTSSGPVLQCALGNLHQFTRR
jgi:hypothetical protein